MSIRWREEEDESAFSNAFVDFPDQATLSLVLETHGVTGPMRRANGDLILVLVVRGPVTLRRDNVVAPTGQGTARARVKRAMDRIAVASVGFSWVNLVGVCVGGGTSTSTPRRTSLRASTGLPTVRPAEPAAAMRPLRPRAPAHADSATDQGTAIVEERKAVARHPTAQESIAALGHVTHVRDMRWRLVGGARRLWRPRLGPQLATGGAS